jgi:hypothetical protein
VETILEEDGKAIKCRLPITNGDSSLLRDIPHCQINQFESSLIGRENLLRLNHFSQTAIHRLNGIGGINRFANLRGKAIWATGSTNPDQKDKPTVAMAIARKSFKETSE